MKKKKKKKKKKKEEAGMSLMRDQADGSGSDGDDVNQSSMACSMEETNKRNNFCISSAAVLFAGFVCQQACNVLVRVTMTKQFKDIVVLKAAMYIFRNS